jgi:hypothetical protein
MDASNLLRGRLLGDLEFFEKELLACFRPTNCEDFDEALSRVH